MFRGRLTSLLNKKNISGYILRDDTSGSFVVTFLLLSHSTCRCIHRPFGGIKQSLHMTIYGHGEVIEVLAAACLNAEHGCVCCVCIFQTVI